MLSEENTGLYGVVGVEAETDCTNVGVVTEEESRGRRYLLPSPLVGDFFRPMMDAAEVGWKACAMGCKGRHYNGLSPWHILL